MFDVLKGEGSLCFLEGPLGPSVFPNASTKLLYIVATVLYLYKKVIMYCILYCILYYIYIRCYFSTSKVGKRHRVAVDSYEFIQYPWWVALETLVAWAYCAALDRMIVRCERLHVYITTCEQLCLGDERPGRADDVNMVHISHKSLPVSSDEAMAWKKKRTDLWMH